MELMPLLGSQPANDQSRKPVGINQMVGCRYLPPQPPSITSHWLIPIILLGDRGTCVYTTCTGGRDLNWQPDDCRSSILTTFPPSHTCLLDCLDNCQLVAVW